MGMRIDEARSDDQIAGVDYLGGAVTNVADLGDNSVLDRNVGAPARRPGAVHHGSVFD